MHAALVRLTIDEDQAPAAAQVFSDRILPEVKGLAGFVAGYWIDPEDERGFGFILFESEDEAEKVRPSHFNWSAPGVEITGVDVRRVAVAIDDNGG